MKGPPGNVACNVRPSTLALLLAFPCAGLAQTTVSVHLPAGDCVAFASKGPASAPPANLEAPKGDVASVAVDAGQDTLYVWARAFNKVASAPVKGTEWSPRTVDLDRLAQVVVDVRGAGGPVAAANVDLDDGRRTQSRLLDPGAKGALTFFDVKPGSLRVTVHYRAGGKDADPVTQIFAAKADADVPPHFAVALPGTVETVGTSAPVSGATDAKGAAATGTKAEPSAPAPTGGGFNPVGLVFALIVGGGVAAGAWYLIKKNPEAVGGTLERLGAQIPKAAGEPLADPPVAAAPAPLRPEPPQKIVLDPVAPIHLAAPAPIALAAPASFGGEPSFVSDAGIPIPLPEGETVVGRDIGLGLSLAGESTVSRRHARVVRAGGAITLFDDGSTNGTFVNGQRVSGSVALRPGDAVRFGSVHFRYEG